MIAVVFHSYSSGDHANNNSLCNNKKYLLVQSPNIIFNHIVGLIYVCSYSLIVDDLLTHDNIFVNLPIAIDLVGFFSFTGLPGERRCHSAVMTISARVPKSAFAGMQLSQIWLIPMIRVKLTIHRCQSIVTYVHVFSYIFI